MHNVLSRLPGVARLVQVGIRDFSEGELDFARSQGDRVVTHFDDAWGDEQLHGTPFAALAARAIDSLPETVYVSFDIDALDPALCPNTGTPVPGGLSFNQASLLLDLLLKSERRVVGFDLVEVAPGPPRGPEIDAIAGARALYRLCGVVSE
jgi:agmatinase